MKKEDIKNAFDSITLDDKNKNIILTKINTNISGEYNKKTIRYKSHFKDLAFIAASFLLITTISFFSVSRNKLHNNNNNNNNNNDGPQAGSPTIDSPNINNEDTTLNVDNLKDNVTIIEVYNNTRDTLLGEIVVDEELTFVVDILKNATVKDMTDEDYLLVSDSERKGNVIAMILYLEDGTVNKIMVDLDLGICNFNDNYYDIPESLSKYILDRIN